MTVGFRLFVFVLFFICMFVLIVCLFDFVFFSKTFNPAAMAIVFPSDASLFWFKKWANNYPRGMTLSPITSKHNYKITIFYLL